MGCFTQDIKAVSTGWWLKRLDIDMFFHGNSKSWTSFDLDGSKKVRLISVLQENKNQSPNWNQKARSSFVLHGSKKLDISFIYKVIKNESCFFLFLHRNYGLERILVCTEVRNLDIVLVFTTIKKKIMQSFYVISNKL